MFRIDFLILVVVILATFRLTYMFVNERGPFAIFIKIRSFFGIEHDDVGEMTSYKENEFARALTCELCLSVWIAPAMYFLYLYSNLPVILLAISGGVIIIVKLLGLRNGT